MQAKNDIKKEKLISVITILAKMLNKKFNERKLKEARLGELEKLYDKLKQLHDVEVEKLETMRKAIDAYEKTRK